MSERKTPILLRPGGLSGEVMALYRYTRKNVRGRDVIDCGSGKQSVQADFDALLLSTLLDPDSPNIIKILDGVARGIDLNDGEREQARTFRERLIVVAERHNTEGWGLGDE